MRPLFLYTMCSLLCTLPSCSSLEQDPTPPPAIHINLSSEPSILDPRRAHDHLSSNVLKMLFDGLVRINDEGEPEPAIAEDISISKDLTRYTFKLRESSWSNGDPVTAHDFVHAWKQVLDPAFSAPYAYQMYVIKNARLMNLGEVSFEEVGVFAEDDHTLVVELEYPTPYFLQLTAFTCFYPVNHRIDTENPHWYTKPGEDYICNGPFTLVAWDHYNSLVVEKNPTYWERDVVQLDRIELSMIESAEEELALYQEGQLDWAGKPLSSLPSEALAQLRAEGLLQAHPVAATYWYEFNTEKIPFNNAKIRRAFSYALNRERLIAEAYLADQIPATGVVPPTMQLASHTYFRDGDQEQARLLFEEGLQELGLTRESLPKITITFNTHSGHELIAKATQKQWKEIFGIDIDIQNMEWTSYLAYLRSGDYHISRMAWIADYNDPFTFLNLFKYATGGSNYSRWEDRHYGELLEASMQTHNPTEREELLLEAETLLMENMPIAPVYFYTNTFLQNPHLKGVVFNGIGEVDYKWAYIEKGKV